MEVRQKRGNARGTTEERGGRETTGERGWKGGGRKEWKGDKGDNWRRVEGRQLETG